MLIHHFPKIPHVFNEPDEAGTVNTPEPSRFTIPTWIHLLAISVGLAIAAMLKILLSQPAVQTAVV